MSGPRPLPLGELLSALGYLLNEAEPNLGSIALLLDDHRSLAEYEVARFWVMRRLGPLVEARLGSEDPRARLEGVRLVPRLYARAAASEALRRLVKDPDRSVRACALSAVHELGLTDVALPDSRHKPPRRPAEMEPGGWNPTGWLFGLRCEREPHAPRRPPPRARAALGKLPRLESPDDVASLLGLSSPDQLRALMRPGAGEGSAYVEFQVPKPSGGTRTISAPKARLRRAQRALLDELLSKAPLHDACHGFVRGRSTVTNAAPHAGAALVIKSDLKDFFPTIHYRRVAGLFEQLGYGRRVARLLAGLTTHRRLLPDGSIAWPGALPQGAPTSPAIANLVCRRLDARLAGLAARLGGTYTRYADDLTFSLPDAPSLGVGRFFWWVDQICQQEGFEENRKKRRVLRPHGPQRVTGLIVNEKPAVPREARRRFRATLHSCRTIGVEATARGRENFAAYLQGFAAYVQMVQPSLGKRLAAEVASLLAGSGGAEGENEA